MLGSRGSGVVAGLAAGIVWGLAFVAPSLIAPFNGITLAIFRFLVFGIFSIAALAFLKFNPFKELNKKSWIAILILGLTGNTVYFSLMASGVILAGSTTVALIIGMAPILIVILGNLRRPVVGWGTLVFPLLLIAAGLLVTGANTVLGSEQSSLNVLGLIGILLTILSMVSWLIYNTRNSEYLSDNPKTNVAVWTSLTGLGTLITLPILLPLLFFLPAEPASPNQWFNLIFWGVVLGIGASWVATWLWSYSSSRVPGAILGLLIVSETIFGIIYACLIEQRWPSLIELISGILIISGVILGLEATRRSRIKSKRIEIADLTGPTPIV